MDKGFLSLINGDSKVNPNNFTKLLAGGNQKNNKKLKKVSRKQFLNSPELIQKYGVFSDTDNDNWQNFRDCFPFDPTQHQPQIPASLQPQPPQIQKPPTVAQRKAARQPIKTQVVTPTGSVGKAQLKQELEKMNQQRTQYDTDRNQAYKDLQRKFGSEAIGASALRDFNTRWDTKRETINLQQNALRNLSGQIGTGYVDQKALQSYLRDVRTQAPLDIQRAERTAKTRVTVREQQAEFKELQKLEKIPPGKRTLAQWDRQEALLRKQGLTYEGPVTKVDISGPTKVVRAGYREPGGVGFTSDQIVELYEQRIRETPQKKGETRGEYHERITSDPSYQKEATKIISQEREERGLSELTPKTRLTEREAEELSRLATGARKRESQLLTYQEKLDIIYSNPVTALMAQTGERERAKDIKVIKKFESGEDITKKEAGRLMDIGVLEDTRFQSLPYGLQPYRREDERFQVTKSLFVKPVEKITGKQVPDWMAETLDFYIKMGAFAPLLKTGAVVKQMTQQDQRKAFNEYVKKLQRDTQTKVIKGKKTIKFLSQEELFNKRMIDINHHFSKILKETDPNKKALLLKETRRFFNNVYGEQEATRLLTEWASQQGLTPELGAGRIPSLGDTGRITSFGIAESPLSMGGELTIDATVIGTPGKLEKVAEVSLITKIFGMGKEDILQETKITQREQQPVMTILDMKSKAETKQDISPLLTTTTNTMTDLLTPQLQIPKITTTTKTTPKTDIITNTIFNPPPTTTTPGQPTKTPTKIPGIIPIIFPGEDERFKQQQRIGYTAYARIDSTKKQKAHWEKLTDKPQSKSGALDKMARFVDKHISAKGKIEPIKETKVKKGKKIKGIKVFTKPLPQGDGYFQETRHKFRENVVRRGKKFVTTNQWIERSPYRLDSKKEKRTLGKAKKRASIKGIFGFR